MKKVALFMLYLLPFTAVLDAVFVGGFGFLCTQGPVFILRSTSLLTRWFELLGFLGNDHDPGAESAGMESYAPPWMNTHRRKIHRQK